MAELRRLVPFAPLHQPYNLAAIEAVTQQRPDVPQVACFDTSFHRGLPAVAKLLPLPAELCRGGVERYGFHGLSYEYIASILPQVAPRIAEERVVVAHLGSGASLCALRAGHSVENTFGFTALDGLCMGTRPGSVDPGAILYLLQGLGLSVREVENILYKKSGLLGISGVSNDMRALLASSEPSAALAVDYFVYRVKKEIGALAASVVSTRWCSPPELGKTHQSSGNASVKHVHGSESISMRRRTVRVPRPVFPTSRAGYPSGGFQRTRN